METRFPTQLLPGDGHREENVRVPKESAYSCRRATIGSTRIALLVGTKAANKVTTIRVAATIENASGSLGFTPNRNFASSRVRPYAPAKPIAVPTMADRKSTRLNSSHGYISYAVFCLKKKTMYTDIIFLLSLVSMTQNSFQYPIALLESALKIPAQRFHLPSALSQSYLLSRKPATVIA